MSEELEKNFANEIVKIFHLQSHTFTNLQLDIDMKLLVSKLILFDLSIPIIIEVTGDLNFLRNIFKKFNNNASILLNYINPDDEWHVDKFYSITNDLVFLNFNHILSSNKDILSYQNLKLFFFKNFLICYNTCKNKSIKNNSTHSSGFLYDVMKTKMKLKFEYKSNREFFQINRKKKSDNNLILDDNLILLHNQNSINFNFDFSFFYMNIIGTSFDSLSICIDKLVNRVEELKINYLDFNLKERKNIYKEVLETEESIVKTLELVYLKKNFIESIGKSNKSLLSKISYHQSKYQSFEEKLLFFMQSFIVKLYENELNLSKLKTVIDIIKKAIKIRSDDNKYKNERKLNILIVTLAIIQFLVFPIMIIEAMFSMNIKIPMMDYDNLIPFGFLVLCIVCIPLSQLIIFYNFRNLIL